MSAFLAAILILYHGSVSRPTVPASQHSAAFNQSFAFDGDRIGGSRGTVAYVWDARNGKVLQRFAGHREPVQSITLGPGTELIATGCGYQSEIHPRSQDNGVRVWEGSTGKEIARYEGVDHPVRSLAFDTMGKRLLIENAILWNPGKKEKPLSIGRSKSRLGFTVFSPSGATVLGIGTGELGVWDASSGQRVLEVKFKSNGDYLQDCAAANFSADGRQIITGGFADANTARIWDVESGARLRQLPKESSNPTGRHRTPDGWSDYVTGAFFLPDDSCVITGSTDRTVRLWNDETGKEIKKLVNVGPIRELVLSPDGKYCLAKWSPPGKYATESPLDASLWNVKSGREIKRFYQTDAAGFWSAAHTKARIRSAPYLGLVGFSRDGKTFLAVGSQSGTNPVDLAWVYSTETGKLIRTIHLEF